MKSVPAMVVIVAVLVILAGLVAVVYLWLKPGCDKVPPVRPNVPYSVSTPTRVCR